MGASPTPEGPSGTVGNKSRSKVLLISLIAGVLAVALVISGAMLLTGSDDEQAGPAGDEQVEEDTAQSDGELTESSTYTTIEGAPQDPDPYGETDGTVVHPQSTTIVHDAPDGEEIARMEPEQINDTWLPVIDEQDGWKQILLPSRPNTSSGWIVDEDLDEQYTPYLIRVHLESKELRLFHEGAEIGSWTIGIGAEDTPTPEGRTYLMGSFTDENQDFSPIILPLGSHSDTLDDFGGGPGTVAIHTWPEESAFGEEISDGCIKIPQGGLNELTEVPLGTLVLVDDQ